MCVAVLAAALAWALLRATMRAGDGRSHSVSASLPAMAVGGPPLPPGMGCCWPIWPCCATRTLHLTTPASTTLSAPDNGSRWSSPTPRPCGNPSTCTGNVRRRRHRWAAQGHGDRASRIDAAGMVRRRQPRLLDDPLPQRVPRRSGHDDTAGPPAVKQRHATALWSSTSRRCGTRSYHLLVEAVVPECRSGARVPWTWHARPALHKAR